MAEPKINIGIGVDASQAQSALRGFKTTLTEFRSGLDLLKQGLDAAQSAFMFAREGAELGRARDQFDNLAKSINTTSDALLNRLGEATNGMMSNADMIASASDIISLGLADNEDDVVRLATVVGELGLDMGQVILTFANDSVMRLDALGLSVTDVEERTKRFEEQGIAATKAFDMAVLEALEDRVKLLGPAADTATASFMRLEASLADARDNWKLLLADALVPTLEGMNTYIESQEVLNAALDAGVISQDDYNAAQLQLKFSVDDFNESVEIARQKLEDIPPAFGELANGAELAGSAAIYAADGMKNVRTAAEESKPKIDLLSGAMSALVGSYDAAKTASTLLNEGIGLLTDSMIEQERVRVVLAIAMAETDEEKAALLSQFEQLENMNALNQAVEDGTISRYDWIAAVAAGTDAVAALNAQIKEAAGDYDINFQINVTGQVPQVGQLTGGVGGFKRGEGGGSTRQQAGGGFHDGADFVVPPGYNNDSFGPIYVESGERVQVTPAAEMNAGGGGGGDTTVVVMLDGKEIAAHVQTMSGRNYRTARNSGAGLTGR